MKRLRSVSSNTRHQGEVTHYSRSQASTPDLKQEDEMKSLHLVKWPIVQHLYVVFDRLMSTHNSCLCSFVRNPE